MVTLTPYLAQLLTTLPQHSEGVFASTRPLKTDAANIKRRERDNTKALQSAGIDGLTLRGLRRAFSLRVKPLGPLLVPLLK